MAQNNCVSQIPSFGETQPNVLAWADWRGGCKGSKGVFPINVDANLLFTGQYGIGANDIDSLWVPPNVKVTLGTNGDDFNDNVSTTLDGNNTSGAGINYPGLYQLDQPALDVTGKATRMGANDVDIVSTRAAYPWSEHLYKCCSGEITDARLCGQYKPGAAVCKSRLLTCTGEQLKNDEGCQTMCRADLTTCDKIKRGFCDLHPDDKYCTCMNVEDNPDYMKLEAEVIKKTGQAPRLGCSPFGRCMTGTDLLDLYLPKNIIDDKGTTCPSYSAYIDQSVTTSGDNNIVNTEQNAGNDVKNSNTPAPESTDLIKGISNKVLIIIIGLILLCIGAAVFFSMDTDDGYKPMQQMPTMGQMAPPMQQPMYNMQQMPAMQPMMYGSPYM